MTNPKVSVIIPVYNTANYLESSVSSIQEQTLRDIEILIIDDGSTDNSPAILKKLSESDARIRLFTQSNQGQSAARNLGLDNAQGDYVYFMDSDDILELNTLSSCYEKCDSQNLDIVIFDADVFYESKKNEKSGFNYIRSGKINNRLYNGTELMEELLKHNLFKAVPWLFFVKRELIEKIKLRFSPGIIHEDELFTPILFLAAERMNYIPHVFFHRRIRENSTMTNKFSRRNLTGYFTVIEKLKLYNHYKDNRVSSIIDRLIENIVISVSDQAGSMSVSQRYSIIQFFFAHNLLRYLRFRSAIIMLSPFGNGVKEKVLKPIFKSFRKHL